MGTAPCSRTTPCPPWFTSVKQPTEKGRILLLPAAKAAFKQYQKEIAKWAPQDQRRVDLRTVDTAQGQEADVVIVDIVKASDFIDERHRLCVALSCAIQGEIILMSEQMSQTILTRDGRRSPLYLSRVWTHCQTAKQILHCSSTIRRRVAQPSRTAETTSL